MMDEFASFRQSDHWRQIRQLMTCIYGEMVLELAQSDPTQESAIVARQREAAGAEKMLRKVVAAVQATDEAMVDQTAIIKDVRKFVYDQIKGA